MTHLRGLPVILAAFQESAMTVFGRTLDGQDIASLVFLLLALVVWIAAWRGQTRWQTWINRTKEGRAARQSAGVEGKDPPPPTPTGPRDPLRPWD